MSPVHRLLASLCVVLLLLTGLALAKDQETKIHKKDLPAVVQKAFERDFPLAKITGAARENENNVEYYEITTTEHGTKRDVLYQADGGLVSVEEVIHLRDLPTVVRDGVMKAYPKGKIKSAEKITRASISSFEVVVKDGKRSYELAVAADGRITETEEKTGKEDND
jgi:hypothetical protein